MTITRCVRRRVRRFAAALALAGAAAGCGGPPPAADCPEPARWRTDVLATHPHDDEAFTQGLEAGPGDATLYESTGRYGRSDVRVVETRTGRVRERVRLPSAQFAEGLTRAGDTLWQLTWREGVAYARDPETLEARRTVRYRGEGWGLCHDDRRERLVMSDGSDRLTFRDPRTFAVTGSVRVTEDGRPLEGLNELECVEGQLWANVYPTPRLVRIGTASGQVTATADTAGLPGAPEPGTRGAVANGVAAVPGRPGEFWLTGKLWPRLYRVRLTPPADCPR